jgi:protein gp37
MGKSLISWTDKTWNPITGCTPVSSGCANCYAKKHTARLHRNPSKKISWKYRNGFALTVHPQCLDEPLRWRKPRRVFVNSMSDTFHQSVPRAFIEELFKRMECSPQHIFQVLTKRAERLADLSQRLSWPENVWAGVTIESADYLDRLDSLRCVPARTRFVSFEPLLGPIREIDFTGIHWAIVGGESGSGARPMNLEWARDIWEQCAVAGVAFFFKQVGGPGPGKGGELLDGREWHDFPSNFGT